MNEPQLVTGLSNREFLETYAAPGRVGLASGSCIISRGIARAQRSLTEEGETGRWTHAFLMQGRRMDGHHWVVESDLDVHRKHIRLGVQENRLEKFWDESQSVSLAVMDFGLGEEALATVMAESLGMVAGRVRYALRELLGTLIAIRRPGMRARPNPLDNAHSVYCSAFVAHVLRKAGLDPAPGLSAKNIAPEDIFRSPAPAQVWLCLRDRVKKPTLLRRVGARLKRG